ncbi:hypothetical protein [Jeotgalibacillus haloalkalitolerans]|uniref:Uncharacterized protein n=1 Tax=Jeotgalibacillus haloalkalitolerans TaxID=3104292 RepID=A0ABU5KJ99_9BACL|nr:hypothetical protein [Jeotgalibacillus sp. HH7-29]MDZ5710821.1 hypothetical protein [Jeotgalibacillus sp. HH7-29]
MYSDFNVEAWLHSAPSHNPETYPSPAGKGTSEEILLKKRYIELANIFLQLKYNPEKGKVLLLQSFLVEKRNQTVEVICRDQSVVKGRVQDIGRDYLVLTSYFTKYWVPYSAVSEVRLPYGAPEFTNTHQYVFFDNHLRKKLLRNFGATVSRRAKLKEMFYRETLKTSLRRWRNSWLKVDLMDGQFYYGKLINSDEEKLRLLIKRKEQDIPYEKIKTIKKSRFR